MLNTIAKSGRILSLFTRDRPEWGVREIAATLGAPKSNVHDLLVSLAHIGLLERTAGGRYRLGWRLLALSRTLVQGAGFQRVAAATMREMAQSLGETVHLGVWDGRYVIPVASVAGPRGVRLPGIGNGGRLPGHSTAMGKAILAHRPWTHTLERAQSGFAVFTERTITDIDVLARRLEEVRVDGVARDEEETYRGVSCVAAPLRDEHGTVVAAVSITAPSERVRARGDVYADAVSGAARRLTESPLPDGGQPLGPLIEEVVLPDEVG